MSTEVWPSSAVVKTCDFFVGIDGLIELIFTGQLPNEFLYDRHAGRAADQDDLVDLLEVDLRVGDRGLERPHHTIGQIAREVLEVGARYREIEVLRRAARIHRDER